MTFDARELSFNAGQPFNMATFACGGYTLRVCAADQPMTAGGHTWEPWPIQFPQIVQASEINRNDLRLVVPATFPIAQLWLEAPPAATMLCLLHDGHAGEGEIRETWTGHVANVTWQGAARAEILLASGLNAMKGVGLHRVVQRHCNHSIYSPDCGVVLGSKATAGTVDAIGGNWVEASEFATQPDGWFDGGILQWTDAQGIPDWRMIKTHVGNRVTLAWPVGRLLVADAVTAHAGCNNTPDHCGPKFNNMPNYGGLWHFKTKNPFEGMQGPIY